MQSPVRSLLIAGERRKAALVDDAVASRQGFDADVALAYGLLRELPREPPGWTSLGGAPLLERPLRLSAVARRLPAAARALVPAPVAGLPLLAPLGRRARAGFRDISATADPRVSRLWGRFSVDVGVSLERDARFFERRVWGRPGAGYRVFVVEDGDRYAIRGMCVFTLRDEEHGRAGYVLEVLHDRTVEGMRSASHVLGLALRAMSDEGAAVARACSLPHSGSFPIYLRHGFLPHPSSLHLSVRSLDASLEPRVTVREHWYLSYLDVEVV